MNDMWKSRGGSGVGSGGYRHCQRDRAVDAELRGAVRSALVEFQVAGRVGGDNGVADAIGQYRVSAMTDFPARSRSPKCLSAGPMDR